MAIHEFPRVASSPDEPGNDNQTVSLAQYKAIQQALQRSQASEKYFRERQTWRKQVDAASNKKLTGNEKLVINALQEEVRTNSKKNPDEHENYLIYIRNTTIEVNGRPKELRGLASYTGLSPDVFGDTLKKLHAKGLIVRTEVSPDKYKGAKRIYVRFTELFSIEGFNSLFDGAWGGNREAFRCQSCGDQRCKVHDETTKDITRTCMGCGGVTTEHSKTVHDYTVEPDSEENSSQESEPEELPHISPTPDKPHEQVLERIEELKQAQSDEREQVREQRVEQQRDMHNIGLQSGLERRGLTLQDVVRKKKPKLSHSTTCPTCGGGNLYEFGPHAGECIDCDHSSKKAGAK